MFCLCNYKYKFEPFIFIIEKLEAKKKAEKKNQV